MAKLFILFVLGYFILFIVPANSQNWEQLYSVGDTTGNTSVAAMTRYGDNQIAIVGKFESRNLKFGNLTVNNNGSSDAFVAIADGNGNFLWAMSVGGKSNDAGTSVATDKAGNIYVGGNFSSQSVKIGNTTLTNKGDSDGFLVKINPQKQVEWAIAFGSLNTDEFVAMEIDGSGKIFAAVTNVNQNNFNYALELYKIDTDNKILWQRTGNTKGYNSKFTSLTLDKNGNCYAAGGFTENLTFEGKQTISSVNAASGFVVKYGSDGLFLKLTAVKTVSCINDLAHSGENLYITGENLNYGWGWGWPLRDSKINLIKLNSNLSQIWARSVGGETALQSLDIPSALGLDEKENIYLTGYFFSPEFTFGGQTLLNIKHKDYYYQQAFLLKYKSNGDQVYGKAIGSILCETGTAIMVFSDDNFLLAGTYESASVTHENQTIYNNGEIKELYVHLRPTRQGRNTFAFFAQMGGLTNNIPIQPEQNPIVAYYSPVHGKLYVTLPMPAKKGGYIDIIGLDGNRKMTVELLQDEKNIQVKLAHLKTGIYLVKINSDNETVTRKILKQ
jgi:hypothetical protein